MSRTKTVDHETPATSTATPAASSSTTELAAGDQTNDGGVETSKTETSKTETAGIVAATDENIVERKATFLAAETATAAAETTLAECRRAREAAAAPIAAWLAAKGSNKETMIGDGVYTASKAKGSDVPVLKKAHKRTLV